MSNRPVIRNQAFRLKKAELQLSYEHSWVKHLGKALGHDNFILRMAGVYRVNGKSVAIAISTASDAEALFSACIDWSNVNPATFSKFNSQWRQCSGGERFLPTFGSILISVCVKLHSALLQAAPRFYRRQQMGFFICSKRIEQKTFALLYKQALLWLRLSSNV